MIYGVLYDSMLAWYKRRKVRPQYLDFYAITSLVAMEFGNLLSIIAFLAYLNVGSLRELFHNSAASKNSSIVLAVLLLVLNYAYFKVRSRVHSRESKVSTGFRLYWVAPVYMVFSVVVAIYASTLVSAFKG
jgi:hypothetical protein